MRLYQVCFWIGPRKMTEVISATSESSASEMIRLKYSDARIEYVRLA